MAPRNPAFPNNKERHALQVLLVGEWEPATAVYPAQGLTPKRMVEKGWIGAEAQAKYRITEAGRQAFRAKIP